MKKQRICLLIVAIILALFVCVESVSAETYDMLRASPTLTRYSAIITSGSSAGKIVITYDIAANDIADSLGVSKMVIYKSDGGYVTTIYATALNNFKASNTVRHRASYTYTGTSGTSYYAEVTVFATIDGVTDSRTITTNTVKAP